jgi:hypothetical protein
MKTMFTERSQRDMFADECSAHAVECHEIAERHDDLIKEQYETLSRQWMTIAATAHGLVACNVPPQPYSR